MKDRKVNLDDVLIGTEGVAARLDWKRMSVHVALGRARAARAAGRKHWFPDPVCVGPHGNLWRQTDIDAIPPPDERRIGGRPPIRAGNRYTPRDGAAGRMIELERPDGQGGWVVRNVAHPHPTKIGNRSTITAESLRRWYPVPTNKTTR